MMMTNKEKLEIRVNEVSKAYAKANVTYELTNVSHEKTELLIEKAKFVGELRGYNWILNNLKL